MENKTTHKSNILSKIILYGETNLWKMIRHMFVVSKSLLRPPATHLKYTKCLLLHLFIFCVLCVVYDTSLPQTSWQIFFSPLKHIHLHFKHVKEMAPVSAAVTVFGRQAWDACLCDTDKIYLAANTTVQHVLQGTVAQMGVTQSQN